MNQETKILSIVGIVTVILLVGAVFLLSRQGAATPLSETVDTALLVKDYNHKVSTDSAKITLVEFADFQCPACGSAFPTIQRLKDEYKKDVTFVFRHFPLAQHPHGKPAARAAEAAGEQGKFWEMYVKLFSNQTNWENTNNFQSVAEGYASELQLDLEKFKSDMKSSQIEDRINNDVSDAIKLNVNSTPTFFLNGERLVGAPSYETLKSKIETQLKK